MAHETDAERKESKSSDHGMSQRVQSLREKTAQLDDTLHEIEKDLEQARGGAKE
jgi:hypothetical protein